VIFLGDTTRPGLAPAAAVGFLVAVASAVMLARFGEAERAAASEAAAGEAAAADERSARDDSSALHAGELTSASPAAPCPSRSAYRGVLFWWPVDMRPSTATSPTTGAPSWQHQKRQPPKHRHSHLPGGRPPVPPERHLPG
jgi:hypothetical protein